jgi:hypothetical protein
MRGKPEMLYSDAEPGLTSNMTQKWLREQNIAHNITLRHAPVAERMIGHIKNQIIQAIRGTNKKWWEVVDAVVKDYNENHVSRNTLMTPKDAAKTNKSICRRNWRASERPTTNNLASPRGQGQGRHQEEVREGLHAGLERRGIYCSERIKGSQRSPLTHISYQPYNIVNPCIN